MQESTYPAAESRKLFKTGVRGIFRRGGRYVVVYRDPQGRQRKAFAKTLAEARSRQAELRADITRGEYRTDSRTTFGEYAVTWIDTYQGRTSRGIREATKEDYRRALGLDPQGDPIGDGAVAFFGRMRLSEIQPRDVKRYAADVAARGVSANTVRLAVAPVKALLATAFEEGMIRANPAAGVRIAQANGDLPDDGEERVKALTEEELGRLLSEVPEPWRLLVSFLAQTGMRVSEALPLRWGDFDFGRRRVAIRRSVNRGRVGAPKTRHGRREVPLTDAMARALWNARKAPEVDGRDDALVFSAADGAMLDRTRVFRIVKAAAKRARVPWVGLHTLRHTCATLLFRSGWNAVQVQRFLGHHSAAFTLATYVHLLSDDLPEPVCVPLPTGIAATVPASGDSLLHGSGAPFAA